MEKIYIVGVGGIGISAIARYYNEKGYKVYGSDKSDSELIHQLEKEGIDIIIGEDEKRITNDIKKLVYTEAVSKEQKEIKKALEQNIEIKTYPEELAEITKDKKLITISGTHGKSTTTSLTSIILKDSEENFSSIVGTLLKEFNGKNFFHREEKKDSDKYFVLEACEYKRSFLNYKPTVAIITNIELDHIDYYKDLEDYISAYEELINNVVSGGYVILNGEEENSKKLIGKRKDINYITVHNDIYKFNGQEFLFPDIELQIPGKHILYDARLSFIVGQMIGVDIKSIQKTLSTYNGIWRRMEKIGVTENGNTVISDYGHHPTEIKLTLDTLKTIYKDNQILTVFQPHQYSRTIELLDDFIDSFHRTDKLIIPDIYESRDTKEDKEKINTELLVDKINHKDKLNGKGLDNTLDLINEFDSKNKDSLIILMGAGDVDNLRYKIKTTS